MRNWTESRLRRKFVREKTFEVLVTKDEDEEERGRMAVRQAVCSWLAMVSRAVIVEVDGKLWDRDGGRAAICQSVHVESKLNFQKSSITSVRRLGNSAQI